MAKPTYQPGTFSDAPNTGENSPSLGRGGSEADGVVNKTSAGTSIGSKKPVFQPRSSTNFDDDPLEKSTERKITNISGIMKKPKKRHIKRNVFIILGVILILLISYPIVLLTYANNSLKHIAVIKTDQADQEAGDYDSYLIIGNDSRSKKGVDIKAKNKRSDTIMLLIKPKTGIPALISIPRDTYTNIPGIGMNKINASLSLGNEKLLVQSVENLTSVKVKHFIEIGFNGLKDVTNFIGGVNLCLDKNVTDEKSGLKWKKGCHDVNGKTALAFSRMRYSDVLGDIGRTSRQRQVISAITKKINQPSNYLSPQFHFGFIDTISKSIAIDKNDDIFTLAWMFFAFKDASSDTGIHGTLPIDNMGFNAGPSVGSAVKVNTEKTKQYFKSILSGTQPPGELGGINYK
jgi:LCP family protein required for cell wall assembly